MCVCAVTKSVRHVTGTTAIGSERDIGNTIETGEKEKSGIVTGDTGSVPSDANPHAGSAHSDTFVTFV